MRLTITPREPQAKPIEFWAPDNGGYVRIETDARPAGLGRQICRGGRFTGDTVWATDYDDFVRECRRWYRAARRRAEQNGWNVFEEIDRFVR